MNKTTLEHPVLWFEGMPLLPHHFQQQFLHTQNQSHLQFQMSGSFPYGVIEIEIDKLALTKNIFKINNIFAVLPDGLMVKIDHDAIDNLQYTLPEAGGFDKKKLDIFITAPKLFTDNYLTGKFPRYKKESFQNIVDIASGQEPTEILKMLPNIQIFSEIDVNPNLVSLKIAQLKIEKNLWDFAPYAPATFQVNLQNPLSTLCSELCYFLRKKIQHLAELFQSKSSSVRAHFISENLLYAQGLGLNLPALEGLLSTNQAHPFQLYLALCQILGGIGLMTDNFTPPSPVPYQHEELLETFKKIKMDIENIVNAVIDEKISQIYFTKEKDIFKCELTQDPSNSKVLLLGFKRNSATKETELLNWIKNAIICDFKNIDSTLQNRTLGLERKVIERTEDIVPVKGVYLVQVQLHDDGAQRETMAIFNLDDTLHAPDEIFIFVKKELK